MTATRKLALLLGAALAAHATAQTTGVPGINDYTINGLTSGSSSCPSLCFPGGGVPITFDVSTTPGNFAMVFVTDCPCRGCVIPWPPNACVPAIPPGALPPCAGTNQSLDFLPVPGCQVLFQGVLQANAAGIASLTVLAPTFTTPPCSVVLSTQAVVFDVCGVGGAPIGPGPFVLTQAYNLAF